MQKLKLNKSLEYMKKIKQYLPGGSLYNFHYSGPENIIPCNKGKGSRVWDLDGNEHLDLFCKFGALILGHSHEEYNTKLKECIDRILAVEQTGWEAEVCELIIKHIPGAEKVRFSLSGTEAVQNAVRLARANTGRNKFVRFYGHYHGNADNIMGGKANDEQKPYPEEQADDIFGTEGRASDILKNQSFIIPWNNIPALESLLSDHKDDIAAVIMEPICINGGGIMPARGYLQKVRELCSKYNIILIFDEVITGFRVGLGGAQGLFNVKPDITVLAKALAGGALPVSAIAGKKEIMDLYDKQRVVHAGTFNGYAIGLAAVKAAIEILERDTDCYQRMGDCLEKMADIFKSAAKDSGIPLVIQGQPTALVFHVSDKELTDTREYNTDLKIRNNMVVQAAKNYGIDFSLISRMYGNIQMNESDISFFADRIGYALQDVKNTLEMLGEDFI